MNDRVAERTIADFGQQWTAYRDNSGYYGSLELLRDMFGPLLSPEDLAGRRVLEIGSGTGRIAAMLLAAGVAHVTAVEPSPAFDVLRENLQPHADRVTFLRLTGDAVPPGADVDFVFSIGVLHHIPDPDPVVREVADLEVDGGALDAGAAEVDAEGKVGHLPTVTSRGCS